MPYGLDSDDELELTDYLRILRRRWPWVVAPFVATLALATAFTLRQQPMYCSTAQVLLADSDAQVAIQGDANVFVASRDLANEINIAYSDTVRSEVISQLGTDPEVDVRGDEDSDVLWFNGCATTPEESTTEIGSDTSRSSTLLKVAAPKITVFDGSALAARLQAVYLQPIRDCGS